MQPNTAFEGVIPSISLVETVGRFPDPELVPTSSSLQSIGPFEDFGEVLGTFFILVCLLIGLVFSYYALKEFYRALVVGMNRPISTAAVATASGAVELEATAKPLDESEEGRIAYKEERKKKETTRDSDGNEEEKWKTVSTSEWADPFRLADEAGSVVVDPEGANLSIDMERTKSTSRRRKYQGSITPGDTVHVYGHRRSAEDVEDPPSDADVFIGDGDGQFLVSDTTQFRTVLRYFLSGFKYFFFAMVALGLWLVLALIMLDELFGIDPLGI